MLSDFLRSCVLGHEFIKFNLIKWFVLYRPTVDLEPYEPTYKPGSLKTYEYYRNR